MIRKMTCSFYIEEINKIEDPRDFLDDELVFLNVEESGHRLDEERGDVVETAQIH